MTINVAPVGLARDLVERQLMGTDIVARVAHMPGIEVGAISELNLPNAHRAVDIAYQEKGHAREVASGSAMSEAIEAGKVAVTNDAELILNSGLIDVVIDATGVPAVGAEIGLRAMEHGKHLVMMNVEADVTIGAYLKSEADRLSSSRRWATPSLPPARARTTHSTSMRCRTTMPRKPGVAT